VESLASVNCDDKLELSECGLTTHPDNIESWQGETKVDVGIGASLDVEDLRIQKHIQHGLNARLLYCMLHLDPS
jgi:hypothetical protein